MKSRFTFYYYPVKVFLDKLCVPRIRPEFVSWGKAWQVIKNAGRILKFLGKVGRVIAGGFKALLGVLKGKKASAAIKHMHHLLPQEKTLKSFFERAGLNIEKYKIPLGRAKHILKSGPGVHTKAGGDWNKVWKDWIRKNPGANKQQILKQMQAMRKRFGI